jgi:multidrug resistance efflux pump
MKYSRLLLGSLVIAFALWIIVGEQMSWTSANAFVNTRLVTVRSDVAGKVVIPSRALGARVAEREVVASMTDMLVDTIRLNDLLMEQAFLVSERARLDAYQVATEAIHKSLEGRSEVYSRHRIEELKIRLYHARQRLALIDGQRGPDGNLDEALDAVGAATDALPGESRFPALARDHARERVEVLEVTLRAAEYGVFLGDGYNDAPNAQQRAMELRSEIAATAAAIDDVQARQEAVVARIARERQRVNGLTGGDLSSPVDGILWELLAADGEYLERGDPVLKLADCGSVVVSASVSEGLYNSLKLGQSAEFRPVGGSEIFNATVSRLAGGGASTIYRNLAVAPSQKHLERYDVTLQVSGLTVSPEFSCSIGRTGRVFFESRPLDWLRSVF